MKKILIVLSCLLLLVGCKKNSKDTSINNEKISSEIEYVSSQIEDLLNTLNNISLYNYELVSEKISISKGTNQGNSESQPSSGGISESESNNKSSENQSISVTEMKNKSVLSTERENVDWDFMKQHIENVNTSWSIIMLELYNSNVSNEDIMSFSNILNDTIISIKEEDKATTLINLTNLYSYIPKFLTAISSEKHILNIENTKYYVYVAYSFATIEDWNTVNSNLSNAESAFLSVLNDTEYSKNRKYKINKTYMLIKDIQNAIQNNDKNLFFLKYKALIESLNTL